MWDWNMKEWIMSEMSWDNSIESCAAVLQYERFFISVLTTAGEKQNQSHPCWQVSHMIVCKLDQHFPTFEWTFLDHLRWSIWGSRRRDMSASLLTCWQELSIWKLHSPYELIPSLCMLDDLSLEEANQLSSTLIMEQISLEQTGSYLSVSMIGTKIRLEVCWVKKEFSGCSTLRPCLIWEAYGSALWDRARKHWMLSYRIKSLLMNSC